MEDIEEDLADELDELERSRLEQPINLVESEYILECNMTAAENFSVLSINAQSINNKFQRLRDITHQSCASILAVQETWGRNSLTDYSIRGYHTPVINTRVGVGMNLGGGLAFG